VSDDKTNENTESVENKDAAADPGTEQQQQQSSQNEPNFTESPDPLAGVKKTTSDLMASMEGKTVSMKFYVGTIIAIVVLMLLARCGT
jgi:hypothetical protein